MVNTPQQQGAGAVGGGFSSTPNSLGLTPMFQGRWNSNTDDLGTNGSGSMNNVATSHPPANANNTAQMTQGDMLSQMVANLQSQQQQQAQTQQVQAALARVFGTPSGGVDFSSGGNVIGGGTNYDFNNNMLNTNHNNNTLQGMSGMSDMNGNNNSSGIMSSYFSSGQQSNMSARDLLSRMQMLQQQTQQQLQQHQQQDGLSSGLIQLAQQDRQERAMLANQDSIMKKARWGDIGENKTNLSTTTDGTTATLGENSNNNCLFAQFPRGVPTAFTNNFVGNGMNAAQQFGKLSSLVESLQNKQQVMGGMGGGGGLVGMNNNTLVGGMNTRSAALLNPGIASLLAGAAQNLGLVDTSSTMMPSFGGYLTQQRSHQTIVPCRARGMPVDHNLKTAYFVIPDGVEHGDELMCSYPACRQAGVKFRYCLECKIPVAKRNFRNRHRHGVTGEDGGEEYSSEEEEKCEGVDDEQHPRMSEDGDGEHHGCHSVPPLGIADGTTTNHHREDRGDYGNDNDELFFGVKKEHIIIIPGAAAPPLPMIDGGATSATVGMKKKRKGGNIRVPCRARGMPMAHNFKTAYFMIPLTIEHGDELLCSFPSCRCAGVKFRYCLHCKLPVAKRNFRNRHKHGNMVGTDKTKNGGNFISTLKEDDAVDHSEDGASSSVARYDDDSKHPPLESTGANANESATDGLSNQPVTTVAGPRVCVASSQDATKVQRWVELLESKPDPEDKDAMAVWMANLMTASSGCGGSAPSSVASWEDNAGSSMNMLTAASDQVEGRSSINEGEAKVASPIDEENEDKDNLKRERVEGEEEGSSIKRIRR